MTKMMTKMMTKIKELEAPIQADCIKYANKLGIVTIRMYFGPGIQTGWPDVLFLIPGGRPLWIEFKATGKVPTDKQADKIKLLTDAEYDVTWCDNRPDAIAAIDAALDRAGFESVEV
jgi:hypothetical protein